LAPCPEGAGCACALLRLRFPTRRWPGIARATRGPPALCSNVRPTNRGAECVPWSAGLLRAGAPALRSARSRVRRARVPPPPLLACAAHTAPHGLPLGVLHLPQADVNVRRSPRGEPPGVPLGEGRPVLCAHGEHRGRAAPQDTAPVAHPTALAGHSDARLLAGGQPPWGAIRDEQHGAWTGKRDAAIALRPLRWCPLGYHLGTVTIGPLSLHHRPRRSPTSSGGLCAPADQGINEIETSPSGETQLSR